MSATMEIRPPLARASSTVKTLRGWRRCAVAFVAGGLSALAFAPMFLSPVLFVTLPVLVWLIDGSAGPRQAASGGWWFGFGYFFFNLFWIGQAFLVEADKFAWLLPFAITLLPAVLALFWAAAAAASRAVWPKGPARILVFAIFFAIAEWLRGHVLTGFPWDLVGYALTYPLALMQSAAIFGAYGLTLIAFAMLPAPLVLLGDRKRATPRDYASACAAALVPLLALVAYGAYRLSEPVAFVPGVNMRIVQPSVPQKQKWMSAYQRQIFDDHIRLSLANPATGKSDSLDGITHLIWPEAAMPFFPLEHAEALDILAHVIPPGTTLITGALRHDAGAAAGTPPQSRPAFNSILVLDEAGKPLQTYDKIKLVPGGEFIPYEQAFALIGVHRLTQGRGFFEAGRTPRPLLHVPGLPPALGLVCYEALFPGEIVEGKERPGVLINVTNDGWFGDSTGPYQHFHQSRVRAVEEGLPMVRAANNGISAVVDPYGRLLVSLGLDVRAAVDSRLPEALPPTPYARFGDWIFFALLIGFAVAATAIGKSYR